MLRNLKEEAVTLTRWLVSIPSVCGTRGESVAIRAIYDGLAEFPYYRAHPDHLHFVSHEDQQNSSILGLVKAYDETRDTIIILCRTDTQGAESFGSLKTSACKEAELKEKLSTLNLDRKTQDAIDDDKHLLGLGVFECKAAAGSVIGLIREFSDNTMNLDFNLIFLCLSRSHLGHEGIKAMQSYLDPILKAENLNPVLALAFTPAVRESAEAEPLHLYSSLFGLAEPSFFILGKGADFGSPFSGFSPTLIASLIIKKLELNPQALRELSDYVLTPSFAHIFSRNQSLHASPDAVQISFNLPFLNLDLADLTERLKEIAAEAIEECSALCDDRQSLHCYLKGRDFIPEIKDAEVISYQDLFTRAEAKYRGNLNAAIAALLEKCRAEGLSYREMCFCIIERLNELAHLPRPSVVVFLGHNFIPCAELRSESKRDREIIMCLEKTAVQLGQITGVRPTLARACPPLDANFLRPVGVDKAVRALSVECPVSDHSFYNFNCPAVCLGIPGDDLGLPTERVHESVFDYILTFVPAMMDSLAVIKGLKHEGDLKHQFLENRKSINAAAPGQVADELKIEAETAKLEEKAAAEALAQNDENAALENKPAEAENDQNEAIEDEKEGPHIIASPKAEYARREDERRLLGSETKDGQ